MSHMIKEDITLSKKELSRVGTIERLLRGEITNTQAAELLGLSVRQVIRLKKGVKKEGLSFLAHKNRGRKPKHAIPEEVKEKVVNLYSNKYLGANFSHTTELLSENDDIHLSLSTVRRILRGAGFSSPRRHRLPKVHMSRRRMPKEGMLVQMDASHHQWLDSKPERFVLLAAIDDATGKVLGATFRKEEDLEGYFEVVRQMVTNYGIPETLYTDRHTIFKSLKTSEDDDQEYLTQFGKAMYELGINHIFATTPQAKGRIERLWQTFQDRLVIELRLAGITTIEEANEFLIGFIKRFNKRFSVSPLDPTLAYRECTDTKVLDLILCKKVERRILNGSTFSYLGKMYQVIDKTNILPLRPSTKITLHILPEGEIICKYGDKYYKVRELERLEEIKKQETKAEVREGRRQYKPGPDHPWRRFRV